MGLAADRGVTICFADLDGADGLWVPEERTILVSRRLSEERVNEVIEHELAHVAIDDQHAELDAGVRRRSSRLPATLRSKRWAAPALSAAALLALVGGVTAGLTAARPDPPPREIVGPDNRSAVPETAGPAPAPSTIVLSEVGRDGRTTYRTVTVTPPAPPPTTPTATPSGSRPPPSSPVPTRKAPPPTPTAVTTTPAATTPAPTPAPTTGTPSLTAAVTTVPPTSDPPAGPPGDEAGGRTEPATSGPVTDPAGG